VQAAGTVTSFAAHFTGIVTLRLQTRVRGGAKVAGDFFVTGGALIRPDEFGARDARRRNDGAVCLERAAG